MEDVGWSLSVGLDVLASSNSHLKTIAGTRGPGLDKQFLCMGLGRGVDCWGAGAGMKLVLSKLKLDPSPAIRWRGASGAVPLISV